LKEKFLKLVWGPRYFADLLLLFALVPPAFALVSVTFRLIPNTVWGSWLACIAANSFFVLAALGLWSFVRLKLGARVPRVAWFQIVLGLVSVALWVGLIPLELNLHTRLGTPMIVPTFCNTESAIGKTILCRGRDYSFMRQKKAWYYGEGNPSTEQCAKYAEVGARGPAVQESCQLGEPSLWSPNPCGPYGLEDEFVCFTCVEQADPYHTVRNLLAFNRGCSRGIFMYSINYDLKKIL
jgi:hypothetical protein